MLTMILQMTGATVLYVAATTLLWSFWRKRTGHTFWQKLAVGLFYGLCSVAANHLGIDYGDMVLNVRDIGPLAAGLFFDPLSGILSGLIGGIERYLIGKYLYIGFFTRVACGLSTCLAGILAAALHKWVYEGKRPTVIHCLFLGAEMEVFHMYAIFITNREDMAVASSVVKTCALPMILFTGIGLAACSAMILLLSGEKWKFRLRTPKKDTPIDTRFQRWLLVVSVSLFAFSSILSYSLQTSAAYENARKDLQYRQSRYELIFQKEKDPEALKQTISENNLRSESVYLIVDAEKALVITSAGAVEWKEPADPQQISVISAHADGDVFFMNPSPNLGLECLCTSLRMNDQYYLLIGIPLDTVYANRESQMMETLFLEIMIFTVLYLLISLLAERLVIRNLEKVNTSLAKISSGHLTETVSVEESSEFTKLSGDINTMVTALRGYIDAAENRMKEELKLAAEIQDSALPKNFMLPTDRIELYALMTPARQVGGDFYDFFYVGVNQIALVIADVSGKGIPASLFMMRSKTAIKYYARSGMGPAKLLENANNTLCEGNDAEMFVTVWLGILDLSTGLLRCANAGHEYPFLMRAGGSYELLKDKHGLILAEFEGVAMQEYEIQLNPGDRVFVYTDGVPEAVNENKEQYGTKRMEERLNVLKDLPQEQVLSGMLEDVRRFAGAEEQFDDITMLGFTWK